MIPKKIHYCWFGQGEMPELAQKCIASWHEHMPEWDYKLWNEECFDVNSHPYTKEAYMAGKYAFVSDYVRLFALEREGGLYMDVDFMVYKPFDDLLAYNAFAGFEGSKHHPVMMGVCASEPHGEWVREMLEAYKDRYFSRPDGSLDLTTNVQLLSGRMREHGLEQNGKEQDYKDLHVFPVEYFCPRQTTGEYFRTDNTYCDHLGLDSWNGKAGGWKAWIANMVGPKNMIRIIKIKRKLFG